MTRYEFRRWHEFRDWIDKDRQVCPVYWRGQKSSSWPLASTFERTILQMNGGQRATASHYPPYDGRFHRNGKPIWSENTLPLMRDRYLDVFKRATSGLRGHTPEQLDTDQWWALGRHHGLVTPLLDWTDSPYIAAFFALAGLLQDMKSPLGGISFDDRECAIYRLFHNDTLEGDGLRVIHPVVNELGHIQGQRGLFTWLDSEDYFELQGFLDGTGRGDLLTQFVISDQAVLDGLRDLRSHAINYRQLFPDLHGAALYANSLWDVF